MNLLIIDSDISYVKNLKTLLSKKRNINSIQTAREFKNISGQDVASSTIILFEANAENIKELKKFNSTYGNGKTKFVALAKETDEGQLLEAVKTGVSSIIYKTEKTEFISEELELVFRGKGSFPANVINDMKDILVTEGEQDSYRLINIFGKDIYIRKEKTT